MAGVIVAPEQAADLRALLRPDPLPDGGEPEQRVVYSGISWERYLAADKALGEDRSGPRFYYLDGELEIMSTSQRHEFIKKWIAGFMDDYFMEFGIEVTPHGQATMREEMLRAGAEPDESWLIGEAKKYPDIVLEIALTSGGIRKLQLYRRFPFPEVWIWRRNALETYVLNDRQEYERSPRSAILPSLDVELLVRCVGIPNWQEARRAFRAGLAARD